MTHSRLRGCWFTRALFDVLLGEAVFSRHLLSYLLHNIVGPSSLAPHSCSGPFFAKRLWIASATTCFFAALKLSEDWMLLMVGLLVGGLVVVRHDTRPSSGTADTWHPRLGSICLVLMEEVLTQS